jgi:flagellar protein FlaG
MSAIVSSQPVAVTAQSVDAVHAHAPAVHAISLPPPVERGLEVHVDSGTGLTVFSVVDRATGEVVRQIPEDVMIRIARYLDAELGGNGAIDTSA